MNRFAELLAAAAVKPATVVHLGAGSCKEHDLYASLNASRIIFVEPDRKLAERAKDKFRNSGHVTVVEVAIAVEKGRHLLNIISNPRFSSLLQPAGLLDFYPNITVIDKVEIETVTLEQLCELENIDDQADNLLVAELQGIEKEVLPATAKNTLHKFKWIVIRSSEHKLYESFSHPQNDLKNTMQEAGYVVFILEEEASPHNNMVCIRNDERIANALLKQREHDLNKSIEVLEQKMFEEKAGFEKQKSTYERQLEGMQKTLRSNNKLVLKSSADLSDLQDQYRIAIQRQDQQHSLLCELKEKLSQAVSFYRKLNLQNLVIDDDLLNQGDLASEESPNDDDSED